MKPLNWLLTIWFIFFSFSTLANHHNLITKGLLDKAKAGDLKAQYTLSFQYWNRSTKNKEYKENDQIESFKWMKKAAESGYSDAFTSLGGKYKKGHGTAVDIASANHWYALGLEVTLKKANSGDVNAQYHLGRKHAVGVEGAVKDINIAIEWYKKAGEQGHTISLNRLGILYLEGTKVHRNLVKAKEYYKKSAENGNAIGKNNLSYVTHLIDSLDVWRHPNQNDISITVTRRHDAPILTIVYSMFCTECKKEMQKQMKWLNKKISDGKLAVNFIDGHRKVTDTHKLLSCISKEKGNRAFLDAFFKVSRTKDNASSYAKTYERLTGMFNISDICLNADFSVNKEKVNRILEESKIITVPTYFFNGKIYKDVSFDTLKKEMSNFGI